MEETVAGHQRLLQNRHQLLLVRTDLRKQNQLGHRHRKFQVLHRHAAEAMLEPVSGEVAVTEVEAVAEVAEDGVRGEIVAAP